MAETKDQIAASRDQLAEENARLRAQLQGAGIAPAQTAPTAQHTFQLSEGDRQELEQVGWLNIGGVTYTREQVIARLGDDQKNVPIAEAVNPQIPQPQPASNIRGVDFVYPSVTRGGIDPKVAGTPGINGPAATTTPADPPAVDLDDE